MIFIKLIKCASDLEINYYFNKVNNPQTTIKTIIAIAIILIISNMLSTEDDFLAMFYFVQPLFYIY